MTKPKVSRKRAWQLRKVQEGKCPQCGKPSWGYFYCEPCRVKTDALRKARRKRKPIDKANAQAYRVS